MGNQGFRQTHGDSGLGSISAVVGSLPVGYTLGESRMVNEVKYRLIYNSGGASAAVGHAMIRQTINQPYSLTVTCLTELITGAVGVVQNATLTTDAYAWIAVQGHPVSCVASNISIATGMPVTLAKDGKFVTTATSGNWVAVNVGDAAAGTTTAVTDTAGDRFEIFFESNHLTRGSL